MANKLIITPEAEMDINDAYNWYQLHRLGLGEEFLTCVEACLNIILRNPQIFAKVHQNYRRSLVRRFPYSIFYEYENETITVYGAFHTSRDSGKWRKRLP